MKNPKYIEFDSVSVENHSHFREAFHELESAIERLLVSERPKAIVIQKLEEAYMWVGKTILKDQLARTIVIDDPVNTEG